MSEQFRLQDPGEGIHEAQVLEVHVSEGDEVSEGDDLFTVETDKASVVIPSPFDGTIEEVSAKKGDSVNVGDVLLAYSGGSGSDGDSEGPQREQQGTSRSKRKKQASEVGKQASDGQANKRRKNKKGGKQAKDKPDGKDATAGDEKRAESAPKGEDGQPEGDQDGQVRKGDEREKKEQRSQAPAASKAGDKGEDARPEPKTPASPATRRLARELDVDLEEVSGSGPGGRVESEDVERAAGKSADTQERKDEAARRDQSDEEAGPGGESKPGFNFERWGEVETVEPSATRRRIADHMEKSWRNVPHVMHSDYVDVSRLEALRRKHAQDYREQGGKLTVTVFALKAVALALKDFPRFNASLDPDTGNLVLKRYCHIGVAIDTDEGLLVPVLRDVDTQSLSDLARNLEDAANRAREGELRPDDMQGGSISLTNPGGLGASFFTPIINYPQVAIVGLGTMRASAESPGVPDASDERYWLPLIVSFDHRVNDGADAARFARRIGQLLSSPEEMLFAA